GHARAGLPLRPVALQAHLVAREPQEGVLPAAVRVVARVAANALLVHPALHEVVSLHPVLVSRSIREVGEAGLSQTVLFKIPGRTQPVTGLITDGPVVVPAF